MLDNIYALILHGVTIISIFTLLFYIFKTLAERNIDSITKQLRALSFAGGILIFLGAKTSGMDIPTLVLSSINVGGALLSNLSATLVGAFMAWLIIRMIKKSKQKKKLIYLFIMTSTFIIFTFSDMYLTSKFTFDGTDKSTLQMNLFFIIGLIISVLFQLNTDDLVDDKESNHRKKDENFRDYFN